MKPPGQDLSRLAATTQDVYERNAARFDVERAKGLHERRWLDRFLDLIAGDNTVLDLGCGTGDPIADYLAGRGFRVTGIDASRAMLAIARRRVQATVDRFQRPGTAVRFSIRYRICATVPVRMT